MFDFILKFLLTLKFFIYCIYELVLASFRVAYNVLTPVDYARPGIIAVPLDCKGDLQITLVAIIISLTPGTLALDVSKDKKKLFIHAMFVDDINNLINTIKQNIEVPIMRILS